MTSELIERQRAELAEIRKALADTMKRRRHRKAGNLIVRAATMNRKILENEGELLLLDGLKRVIWTEQREVLDRGNTLFHFSTLPMGEGPRLDPDR